MSQAGCCWQVFLPLLSCFIWPRLFLLAGHLAKVRLSQILWKDNIVVEIIRTGFLVSGFYLPERAAELSRALPSFAISFFLPNNNQADPGKPVFSIGENEASHIEIFTKQIDCWKDMLLWFLCRFLQKSFCRVWARLDPIGGGVGGGWARPEKSNTWCQRPAVVVCPVQVGSIWPMWSIKWLEE